MPVFALLVSRTCAVGIVLLAVAGCAKTDEGPPPLEGTVSAGGTVTMDGKPVAGAMVIFLPIAGGGAPNQTMGGGNGSTDENGKYTLSANPNSPGVLPGSYRVVISRMAMPDGSPAQAGMSPEQQRIAGARESISADESGFATSKLTATVPAAGGTFDFEVHAAE